MAKLNQSLINAIEVILESALKTVGFDKSIVGSISAVLANNQYTVKISGKEYTVKDTATYSVNELVWVRIPCNNYSRMFIDRKVVK